MYKWILCNKLYISINEVRSSKSWVMALAAVGEIYDLAERSTIYIFIHLYHVHRNVDYMNT